MCPGAAFGELALQKERATRKATVRAERFTELATINAQYYNKCIKKIDQKRLSKKVDFLMKLDCFQACSKNAVIKFTYLMDKIKLKRNQKVYQDV